MTARRHSTSCCVAGASSRPRSVISPMAGGAILDGEIDVSQMSERIFEAILRHASGEKTRSELLGLGDHEFVPWHPGIVS